MGMRCFCAQAQKQVDKCEIYLAISSCLWMHRILTNHTFKTANDSTVYCNTIINGDGMGSVVHPLITAELIIYILTKQMKLNKILKQYLKACSFGSCARNIISRAYLQSYDRHRMKKELVNPNFSV